jgi:hypothetical protein
MVLSFKSSLAEKIHSPKDTTKNKIKIKSSKTFPLSRYLLYGIKNK